MPQDVVKSAARQALQRKALQQSSTVIDKNFKGAGLYSSQEHQTGDIDVVCPANKRIRSGMMEKQCAGMLGGVVWRNRLAVLSKERLYVCSQEHGVKMRGDTAELAQVMFQYDARPFCDFLSVTNDALHRPVRVWLSECLLCATQPGPLRFNKCAI